MSTQAKTIFSCSNCDAQFPKWNGRCSQCGQWGTVREGQTNNRTQAHGHKFNNEDFIDLNKVSSEKFERIKTNMPEIDQIFGGGIVPGGLILLGGEPGIGKSTLVLQILKQLSGLDRPLLYVSGEESAEQIKLRMQRLDYKAQNLKFLMETNVEQICAAIAELKPCLAIIDSIQTVYSDETESEAGSVNQIRCATVKLLNSAKQTNTTIIITGHVTKDGTVAGPKTLEHLVDVVMYLEGDKLHDFRLLRSLKNRFGSTNEVGVFEMTGAGLIEVKNPTNAFLEQSSENLAGSVISCFMEGTRVFMIEVQALVTPTFFGYPQRKIAGYDLNRLQMISAVLFKRAGLNLNNQDIHLNIAGGIKVSEPAIDLAVALAIVSALKNKPIAKDTIVIGELGLGGEIRNVQQLEKRIAEAEKLGFQTAIIPDVKLKKGFKIELKKTRSIKDALRILD
ncbi:MAG: DNA repair protein RadA [Parcubacteria group bacterium]